MHEAVFDSTVWPATATQEDVHIVQKLWAKELAARHQTPTGPLPGFALIGDVREGAKRIVFSMFSAGGAPSCESAPNGSASSDIYVECRMRVSSWPASAAQVIDLPGYCMIFAASETHSRVEYRYDTPARTLHFRTIQFGKVVPRCTRSLKLG